MGYFAYDTVRYIERKLAGHVAWRSPGYARYTRTYYCCYPKNWRWWIIFPANSTLSFMLTQVCHGTYLAAKKRLKELLANLRKPVEIPAEAPMSIR